MNAILIGYGEIGKGLYQAWKDKHNISIHDPEQGYFAENEPADILLIAIPYSESFVDTVKRYRNLWGGNIPVIVFSSVPIGTCKQIPAVHSPIEGNHGGVGDMANAIRLHTRYVGGYDRIAMKFFHEAGYGDNEETLLSLFSLPDHTEFLKLRSTTLYGINIEQARYAKNICDSIGLDYELVKQYDRDYNKLVRDTNRPNMQRYVLDSPKGRIGGHCIMPNAELLNEQYPHSMIKYILDLDEFLKVVPNSEGK